MGSVGRRWGGRPVTLQGSARPPLGGGGRFAAESRPAAPKAAAPTHLHVGHKALLDPPAVFIDLVQELELIIVVTTHSGDEASDTSRLPLEIEATSQSTRSAQRCLSGRRRDRLRPKREDGKRRGSKLDTRVAFL